MPCVLLKAAMGIRLKVLDPSENCPAASVAEQVLGDFSDFETVRYCRFPASFLHHLRPLHSGSLAWLLSSKVTCVLQSYILMSAGTLA